MDHRRIAIETYDGPVEHGQEIPVSLADWVTGFELVTDYPLLCFALCDVNTQILAQLPHAATLPEPDPITGSVEYFVGPFRNRSSACPLTLRAIVSDTDRRPHLRLITKGLLE